MTYFITDDVVDNINLERFKVLLRSHNLHVSGTKNELVQRVVDAVNGYTPDTTLDIISLDNFIADEISHGKNRMLFVSSFPVANKRALKDPGSIEASLISKGLHHENFNSIRTTSQPNNVELVYLNIYSDNLTVKKISLSFAKTIRIEGLLDQEGEVLPPKLQTDFVWVDILPDEEKILIKIKPRSSYNFDHNAKTREIYEEISTTIREIFNLAPRQVGDFKNLLYKMFKDLTQTSEEPFRKRVNPLLDEIKEISEKWAYTIGLPNNTYPVDLPYRLFRLLERAIIQNEFFEYQSYFEGKRGIVDRFVFSDPTGAQVNARSGHVDDGIALADIYFDTRDTIEISRKFDKLWVTWFFVCDLEKAPEKIETKFEVYKDHYIIHFLYTYTTKEVEDHVLSNIKHYETLPD